MDDELKARIILDMIDLETGFNWDDNDDVWIDAIKSAFNEIRKEERKNKNEKKD